MTINGYFSETSFPECDWCWSDIDIELAYDNPDNFWGEAEIYDVNGNPRIYEFRPLIELPTVYGVRVLDEDEEFYCTKYFDDAEDAREFAKENA